MRALMVMGMLLWGLASTAVASESAVILMYHRFGDDRYPSTNIRLDQFDAHLKTIRDGGFTVLPLPEILGAMATGRPLPDRTVAITIDDAWASVWTHAWPRLKAAKLPFTLFVVTDETDRGGPNMMTWDQIREVAASGLATIGTQGAAHPHMAAMTKDEVAADIARARSRLAAELGGQIPDLFAWPFGEAGLDGAEAIADARFTAAFGQHSGVLWSGAPGWYLPRFALNEAYGDAERFHLAVNALPLKVTDISPPDPHLATNPPRIAFTLVEPKDGERLACFASHEGKVKTSIADARVTVTLTKPFTNGRGRINCTAPGPEGRWRWFGWQFTTR